MKRQLTALLALLLFTYVLSGCAETPADTPYTPNNARESAVSAYDGDSSAATAAESTKALPGDPGYDLNGKLVGFSCPFLAVEFFSSMSDEFENFFVAHGARYIVLSADGNPATQVENIENFITMGTDVLILFLVDESAATDALISARASGVYVVVVAHVMDNTDAYDVCITVNQYESGVAGAQMAAEWINTNYPNAAPGSIEVAMLISTAQEGTNPRNDGMRVITELTDKAKIYEYDLGDQRSQAAAMQYVEQVFLEHPDVKLFLCFGSEMALAADEVAMSKVTDREGFAIIGVDSIDVILDRIGASETDQSLIRGAIKLGFGTPYTVYQIVIGEWADKLADNVYPEECVFVGIDNYINYYSARFN